jgi:PHP family Zn ribbon phosphoesterase
LPRKQNNLHWYNVDLHIHTPASSDFQQENVSYIDLLQRAETRGLDILAFTDHNSVSGYRTMMDEVAQLEMLEKLNRLMPEEKSKLAEYRRLFSKMVVLPGFEFTATFGFHIIGIFSPLTPIRDIEHLLLNLNIPSDQLDDGSATVGATSDVLTAYRLIKQAGGISIAAHANSTNGVAMKGFSFGGQTRIAYTQDQNLDALEVTDLELKGGRSTAGFFNGTKPEYPRRMHCIQGSDCHRLTTDPVRKKNLGVGDRTTDFFLAEPTFEAILDLFSHNDFARTRPHRLQEEPAFDFIQAALDEGPNIIQEFNESMAIKGGKLFEMIADICAFANTNGGTIYAGLSPDVKKAPIGITDPEASITILDKEITKRISPPIHCTCDVNEYKGKKIIRVLVPRGDDPPYALDDNRIYVRDEAETGLAVRDEIVGLVLRGQKLKSAEAELPQSKMPVEPAPANQPSPSQPSEPDRSDQPRTGVEIIASEVRNGTRYYIMRDLRNGNIVKNVTQTSARKLWHYAIKRYDEIMEHPDKVAINWQEDYGEIPRQQQGKIKVYDLVKRAPEGMHYFFGVTPNGIHGHWKVFLEDEE